MHRHNGTDYQHANDCPHCWREASDIQSEAIKSLRAQLAEKERECERLREARDEAIAFLRNDRYSTRVINALRALENDDG